MCKARFRSLPGGNLGAGKGLSEPDSKPMDPHPSVKWSLTAIKKEVTWVSHSRHRARSQRPIPRRVSIRAAQGSVPAPGADEKEAARLIDVGVTRASHRLIMGVGVGVGGDGDGRFGQRLGA